ncbi:hypothetical protein WJX72_002759 [[Myrmecia] bisecta]|uniref:Tubulin-specific chaperone D n=1 Tax=[Myrmecia] bisecta TaxID=41462 RepID=A0AAW1PL06_9CHLO
MDGAFECIRECTYVEEADELNSLIGQAVANQGEQCAAGFPRFWQILQKYQEQSQLLDPHLDAFVTPLAGLLRAQAAAAQPSLLCIHTISSYLWTVASVRGYKTIVKFFPNEAADLEPVVALLVQLAAQGTAPSGGVESKGEGVWEAQCVLMLWLSQLVLIPFDLATVDTSLSNLAATDRMPEVPPVVQQILVLCRSYLASPGSIREMAALLVGRLLTRPDMAPALRQFLAWAHTALHSDGPEAVFVIPGAAHALAAIFKLGQRQWILPIAPVVWPAAAQLVRSPAAASNVLARKLAIKLVQRVGLTFLAPCLASWRYQRGHVSLTDTLARPTASGSLAAPSVAPAANGSPRPSGALLQAAHAAGSADDDAGEEVEVADEVEEVVEMLLVALRDKDTVVRWSAAKGLGRVTGRLPKELGDQVAESVLDTFAGAGESDTAWHGGCLALAELAQRGLLLPARLVATTPIIAQALQYDVRRGPHSVGAHVRDAAAYVCWAFARAYSADVMAGSIASLAPALLTTACYDREVNCRRAASAAFQESLGRQGTFPHGIDIVTAADYFTLSTRTQAYLTVAPYVAHFPEYQAALAEHLLHTKLRHWEQALRELTAKALAALVPTNLAFFATTAVDCLIPLCLDSVLEVRHGAGLGLGEVMLALHRHGQALSPERQAAVAGVVPAIEKARLYRGKGGELMRSAVCRLMECTALLALPLTPQQHIKLHDSIDENLRHPSASIQKAAAAALHAFSRSYLTVTSADNLKRTVHKYVAGLHDANVAIRRGYASALGALPKLLLQPTLRTVLDSLAGATQVEEDAEDRDAESRVCAVNALAAVALEVFGGAEGQGVQPVVVERIAPSLLAALDDYSTDNRGDVGSWVREAAMGALQRLLVLLARHSHGQEPVSSGMQPSSHEGEAASSSDIPAHSVVSAADQRAQLQGLTAQVTIALVKQAVERIARLREAAGRHLKTLLEVQPGLEGIPARSALEAAVLLEDVGSFATLEALPRLALLVVQEDYREAVLEGLAASIGGLDASLTRSASAALVQVLTATSPDGGQSSLLAAVASCLLAIWAHHARSPRMANPLLRTLDLLYSQTPLATLQPGSSDIPERVLDLVKAEVRQCRDIPRLCAAVNVLNHLAALPDPVRSAALQALLTLLLNNFPKVRKYTAEQLYVRVLSLEGDPSIDDAQADSLLDLLTETAWDGPLEVIRAARASLYAPLGLTQAAVPVRQPKAIGGADVRVARADENASYQSLIDNVERGGQ